MVSTEVKNLSENEYAVHVHVPKNRYDEVYAGHLEQIQEQARSGDNPDENILEGDMGPVYADRLFEMTVSELIKSHYSEAIEKSGLIPAMEPAIEVPEEQQSEQGLEFVMTCVSWPKLNLADLASLDMNRIDINVSDEDILTFIDHLLESEVRFEKRENLKAQQGDQVVMDYEGFIDNEAFEGGKDKNAELILGQSQFIPGFEEGLIGVKAGDELHLELRFPGNYQASHLAGKDAMFKVKIASVAKAVRANDQHELAGMLDYNSADQLRDEVINTLALEAENAAFEASKESVIEALLANHSVTFPVPLIEQEIETSILQMRETMQRQGMPFEETWLEEEGFQDAIRRRSEKWLLQALILRTIQKNADLQVSEQELDGEIDRLCRENSDTGTDEFRQWIREDDERVSAIVDELLEKKCILYVLSQSSARQQIMSLAEWKEKQAGARHAN